MSNTFKLRKGLDIRISGEAKTTLNKVPKAGTFAIKPIDFKGIFPKLMVKQDDAVKVGTPLFFDKYHPEVKFTSPKSGRVLSINRGERRKILEIIIESNGKDEFETFDTGDAASLSAENIRETILDSGLWPFLIRRPYGTIADPQEKPKAVYISAFDSAPLAPDYSFAYGEDLEMIQKGIDMLKKMLDVPVHFSMKAGKDNSLFEKITGVDVNYFDGPHPSGNVGIQIHHIDPMNKGDIVWTIGLMGLIYIGRLFSNGRLDLNSKVALCGSEAKEPSYYELSLGESMEQVFKDQVDSADSRYISGNVLTGTAIPRDGYLGFYDNQVTVIPEGNHFEFMGWAAPGFKKFSVSRTFFSWLLSKKKYRIDTNLNGGERAFVISGQYEKVVPMDILPVYLLKAVMNEDIDKMEQLGIYEVIEEDLALCDFVCTSKIEVQETLRNGLDYLRKELS